MGKIFDDDIKLGDNVFIADTAKVIGRVILKDNANIWFGAVLRGDIDYIEIGENSNVQDNCVLHVNYNQPTIIGNNVTIGHGAIVHGAVVGDNSLIAMNAVLLDGVKIGKNCIVGAGAVVSPGTVIPDNSIVMGIPGKVVKQMDENKIQGNLKNAQEYVELAKFYLNKENGK